MITPLISMGNTPPSRVSSFAHEAFRLDEVIEDTMGLRLDHDRCAVDGCRGEILVSQGFQGQQLAEANRRPGCTSMRRPTAQVLSDRLCGPFEALRLLVPVSRSSVAGGALALGVTRRAAAAFSSQIAAVKRKPIFQFLLEIEHRQ